MYDMEYTREKLETLIEKLSNYLYETLGVQTSPEPWGKKNIPLYLQEEFEYYVTLKYELDEIFDKRILFCIYMGDQTPSSIEKFLRNVTSSSDLFPVLVQKNISTYLRRRLIEKRVPFVIPGSQLYLPFISIDFRERVSKERKKIKFSAFGQYVFFGFLQERNKREWTQFEISERFSCSRMTASRVFQEFIQFGIGDLEERSYWGEKSLVLKDLKYSWNKAQSYFKNPIRKKVFVRNFQFQDKESIAVLAGESALSEISMLAPPRTSVYAIKMENYKSMFVVEGYRDEPGIIELELWRHSIPLTEDGKIHPLALYLSLKDKADERLQIELEKVVNEYLWWLD